jgi:Holliday junction resolvase-like predicted endonuclease
VARGGEVRFVEVKARSRATIDPLSSITAGKQRRLIGAARAWMNAHPDTFDEVCFLAAVVDTSCEPWTTDWYDNPFDGS